MKYCKGVLCWRLFVFVSLQVLLFDAACSFGQPPAWRLPDDRIGDRLIADYLETETEKLEAECMAEIETAEDWNRNKDRFRKELFEMLSLDPLPEKTPLNPVVTGRVEHPEFIVEKLHFQSRPQLYVTANLYLPRNIPEGTRLPTILYVCGHGKVVENGVSMGNKTHYQHHGAWFARNGYVCLTIDTLQLGEIEGFHHGTYNLGHWWWNSRGYTPAGVEAWNCIRALDYLETRPEVDAERFGVTGRSGGGAYSWWIAALDERIKVAVPVAGTTDLRNHVLDGCVEGHCDCMYMINTYRWDFAKVAALVAPRPLLISNTDKDSIFPLDGVVRLHAKVRRIYELNGAGKNLGLQITEGPHEDTQELHLHAFRWFNRFLKEDKRPIEMAALKLFPPAQLKVFDQLPDDQLNTTIHESFVPLGKLGEGDWPLFRDQALESIRNKTFGAWPEPGRPELRVLEKLEIDGVRVALQEYESQENVPIRMLSVGPSAQTEEPIRVLVSNQSEWDLILASLSPQFETVFQGEVLSKSLDGNAVEAMRKQIDLRVRKGESWYVIAPRGVGRTAWGGDSRKRSQIRRRLQLLGQTLASMQVFDVIQGVRAIQSLDKRPLILVADGDMSVVGLYAALYGPKITKVELSHVPSSHREAPDMLNIMRFWDIPEALRTARERFDVDLK